MPFSRRALSLVTSVLGAVLLATVTAWASDDVLRPPASIPLKKSTARASIPMTTQLPPSALGMEEDNSKPAEPDEDKADVKIPDHIKFGDNTLHFDTKRKDPIPHVGIEANDQPVINKATPDESPLPRYFGLRLTTPFSTPSR